MLYSLSQNKLTSFTGIEPPCQVFLCHDHHISQISIDVCSVYLCYGISEVLVSDFEMFSLLHCSFSSVGRLRPHFINVCNPDWSKVDCSDKESFIDREFFILTFKEISEHFTKNIIYKKLLISISASELVCTNPNPRKIRTARTSFPSGHTAAAFHVFLFVYIYLRRYSIQSN